MDRWHINEKEEMEVSDKLEAAFLYMINMRRSMISEACVDVRPVAAVARRASY